MKLWLSAISFIISFGVFACADFSGKYDDGDAAMAIAQSGCETIVIRYEDREETYVLDKINREIYRTETAIVSASAYIVPSSQVLRMTIETKKIADGSTEKKFRRLSLFKKTMLLDQVGKYRADGNFVPEFQTRWTRKN